MEKHKIATFKRFLFLNCYAFLLLIIGLGIAIFPFYKISLWLIAPQVVVAYICLKGAFSIFSSWDSKKRKYDILIQRNTPKFRPETFYDYMQAPCGRLLAKVVLDDLHTPELYKQLKPYQESYIAQIRNSCKPEKTIIYIAEDKQNNK